MEPPISSVNPDLPTIEDRTTSLLEPQIPAPQYEIQQEEHETKQLSMHFEILISMYNLNYKIYPIFCLFSYFFHYER